MTSNDPTPAPETRATSNRDWLWVGLIVAVGGWLRFRNLDAGIPYAVGADEPQLMERVVAMMRTGDFNPHFFDWPTLTFYLQLVVACFTFLLGAMQGQWRSLAEVGPGDFYLHGRMLTAALGTATVWLVYLVGRRWDRATGLVASALFAVVSYHVRESHYTLTDVPAVFMVTLTLLLALRAGEHPSLRSFTLAGIAAGLAASTKYNAGLVVVAPLLVAWTSGGRIAERATRSVAIVVATGVAFLVCTPYIVLDLPKFLNDYAYLASVFAVERPGDPGWAIYLRHVQLAMGSIAIMLAGVGLVGALWRGLTSADRGRWLAIAVFPVIYFGVMANQSLIFGRYAMPMFPFVSVLGAIAITSIGARFSWPGFRAGVTRVVLTTVLAAAAIIGPLRTSLEFTAWLGLETTIDQAYVWIRDNVANGERIVMERQPFILPRPGDEAQNVLSLIEKDYAGYVSDGVAYLVASSAAYGAAFAGNAPREDFEAYQTLFTLADEVATFRPDDDTPGPELRIFRVGPSSAP